MRTKNAWKSIQMFYWTSYISPHLWCGVALSWWNKLPAFDNRWNIKGCRWSTMMFSKLQTWRETILVLVIEHNTPHSITNPPLICTIAIIIIMVHVSRTFVHCKTKLVSDDPPLGPTETYCAKSHFKSYFLL